MTSILNSCKIAAIGMFLCTFPNTNAQFVVNNDRVALQGYIGDTLSTSANFNVNGTIEILNQKIVFDDPNSPTPPTPITPATSPGGGNRSGGGGSSEKYDASNWILQRKYDQLVVERERQRELDGYYTSAPEEPLLPNQDIELAPTYDEPADNVSAETKDEPPIVETPIESKTQPDTISTQPDKTPKDTVSIPLVPSVPAEDKPQGNQIPFQDDPLSISEPAKEPGFHGAFKLDIANKEKLSFTCPRLIEPTCPNTQNKYRWILIGSLLFPWVLIIILCVYGLKKRKELKNALDEIEVLSKKDSSKKK